MYDNGLKSGAHKVTMVVFILLAIVVIVSCAKIILSHIDSDGTVTSSKDACANEQAMSDLEKAGVFGDSKPRCGKTDEQKQ